MQKKLKRSYAAMARDLGYLAVMPDIADRISAATTEMELSRIMTQARHLREDRDLKIAAIKARVMRERNESYCV